MKNRNQIPEKYKWDLSSYYSNMEKFEEDFLFIKNNMQKIAYYEGKLNNEKDIFDCLDFGNSISKIFSRLYVYASLRVKENEADTKNNELLERVSLLSVQYSTISSFVTPELLELDKTFLENLKNSVRAKNYDLIIEDLIELKDHSISKQEEKLLSMMGDFIGGFSDNFDKFDSADVTFEDAVDSKGNKKPLNQATYGIYMQSGDRTLRKTTMQNLNMAYGKFNNLLGSNYTCHVKKDCFSAKLRRFPSALEMSLFGEDVDKTVYDCLIKSVNKNNKLFYEYYDIKRRCLKLDKIAIYDMAAPTCDCINISVPFENAMQIVFEATKPLGQQYVNTLKTAQAERWIDVFPNKGKDTGAFSWGTYGAKPVVLLNYTRTTNDVFTIAHELGHAMHTYYSNNNQPFEKAGYEIFVAEVASTVNEMLLLKYLLGKAKTDKEKMYYYDYLLKMMRTTIQRQTMFAEFEQFVHETYEKEIPLTPQLFNDYYYQLNKKCFGKNVELLPEIKYEWSRIPHFYTSFYVYKYATGLISAIVLSEKIYNGEPGAVDKYIKFLSSGCSKKPVELLQDAGVDLTNEKTFDYAFSVMKNILQQWEKLI